MRRLRWAMLAAGLAGAGPAFAHTSERGHVMLLPTGFYIAGGALAVAASVLLVALLPVLPRWRHVSGTMPLFRISGWRQNALSLAGLGMDVLLLAAGFFGPSSPIGNPLPGFVWTIWWVGLPVLILLIGNVWPAVNPWIGLWRILGSPAPLRLPEGLGPWLAVVLFLAFGWYELVYPTPRDPARLAWAVTFYFGLTFAGLFLFGEAWLRRAECFSLFFRVVGKLSPVQWRERDGVLHIGLVLPGAALLDDDQDRGRGMAALVLLVLATVSFDGFMRTFAWLGAIGVNPLEFPGRSVVVSANTLGLLGMFVILAAGYGLAVKLGAILSGKLLPAGLVWSIVPIAFAYHVAHYLPEFPVSAMAWAQSMGDPFGTGLNFLGLGDLHPPASIMMDYRVAALVYRIQTGLIVLGHVTAVIAAHAMAEKAGMATRTSILGLAPLNLLMIAYTGFGLWLLATPVAG